MIEKENNIIDNNKEHRRRGGAFDTLSSVLRGVKEILFNNGIIIRNRKSELANSNSVFEIFATKPTPNGENYIFIGRHGANSDFNNINYAELSANHNTLNLQSVRNGQVGLRLSVDNDVNENAQITLAHSSVSEPNKTGIIARLIGSGDATSNDSGTALMAYVDETNGTKTKVFAIDKDAFYLVNIPTNASGLTSGAIWSDGGTLKIVT
jgi:hypothetical protein